MSGLLSSLCVAAGATQAAGGPAEAQAETAQAQLSARAALAGPTLDRAERARLLAAPRHWLQRTRCSPQRGLRLLDRRDDEAEAACLARDKRAHLDTLTATAVVLR